MRKTSKKHQTIAQVHRKTQKKMEKQYGHKKGTIAMVGYQIRKEEEGKDLEK